MTDLQNFCDDLSKWITELGLEEELIKASPNATFPLTADKEDEKDGFETLVYLTVWMCLKAGTKAPPHLESRIILPPRFEGPWKLIYSRLCGKIDEDSVPEKTQDKQMLELIDLWELAG